MSRAVRLLGHSHNVWLRLRLSLVGLYGLTLHGLLIDLVVFGHVRLHVRVAAEGEEGDSDDDDKAEHDEGQEDGDADVVEDGVAFRVGVDVSLLDNVGYIPLLFLQSIVLLFLQPYLLEQLLLSLLVLSFFLEQLLLGLDLGMVEGLLQLLLLSLQLFDRLSLFLDDLCLPVVVKRLGWLPVIHPVPLLRRVVADPGDGLDIAFEHQWAVLYDDSPVRRDVEGFRLDVVDNTAVVLIKTSEWLRLVKVVRDQEDFDVDPLTVVYVDVQLAVKTAVRRKHHLAVRAIFAEPPLAGQFLFVFDLGVPHAAILAWAVVHWACQPLEIIIREPIRAVSIRLAAGVGLQRIRVVVAAEGLSEVLVGTVDPIGEALLAVEVVGRREQVCFYHH